MATNQNNTIITSTNETQLIKRQRQLPEEHEIRQQKCRAVDTRHIHVDTRHIDTTDTNMDAMFCH